jgi:hypothetical protein
MFEVGELSGLQKEFETCQSTNGHVSGKLIGLQTNGAICYANATMQLLCSNAILRRIIASAIGVYPWWSGKNQKSIFVKLQEFIKSKNSRQHSPTTISFSECNFGIDTDDQFTGREQDDALQFLLYIVSELCFVADDERFYPCLESQSLSEGQTAALLQSQGLFYTQLYWPLTSDAFMPRMRSALTFQVDTATVATAIQWLLNFETAELQRACFGLDIKTLPSVFFIYMVRARVRYTATHAGTEEPGDPGEPGEIEIIHDEIPVPVSFQLLDHEIQDASHESPLVPTEAKAKFFKYALTGCMCRVGATNKGGHYYTYVMTSTFQDPNPTFVMMNDADAATRPISSDEFVNTTARNWYVACYCRTSFAKV